MSAEVTGVSDSRHLRPKQTQHRRRAKTKASAEKRANQLERMRAGDGGDTFVPRPLVGAGMDVTCLFRVRSRSRVFSAPGRARAWCARARVQLRGHAHSVWRTRAWSRSGEPEFVHTALASARIDTRHMASHSQQW